MLPLHSITRFLSQHGGMMISLSITWVSGLRLNIYFIQSCNGEVYDLSELSGTQKMELAIKFKDDIEANGWTEDDGSPIVLPIY